MIIRRSGKDLSLSIRQGFADLLPKLRRHLWWFFRGRRSEERSELVSEAIALAFGLYRSAWEAGREYKAGPLARYAALKVTAGLRFAGSWRQDVFCPPRTRTNGGRRPIYLGEMAEALLPDRKAQWPIADQAAFRLDWFDFTTQCSRRERFIMELLAAGYRRHEVAERLRVTPSGITKRMNRVHHRWRMFQGAEA